jgi:phenylalanyl-tRNA synthetase beta chain
VILEAAYFEPSTIAFTSRRHALRTEASSRFEKGADPEIVTYASARAARLVVQTSGASAAERVVDEYPAPPVRPVVTLRPERTGTVLGVDIPAGEQAAHLRSIQLDVLSEAPEIRVRVPSFRPDLTREIDLIEEVARLAGLGRLPSTIPPGRIGGLDREQLLERRAKRALAGLGIYEAWTNSFSSDADLDDLGLDAAHPARNAVRIANPSSELDTSLRTTLVPALLRAAARNFAHRVPGVALYEMARVYRPTGAPLPEERAVIGTVFGGERSPKSWTGDQRRWGFFEAKGILEALTASLRVPPLEFAPIEEMPFHPTRAAEIILGGSRVGAIGEVHPQVCDRFEVPEGTVVGEIEAAALFAAAADTVAAEQPARFPPVFMDLAVVVDESVAAGTVRALIAESGAPEVTSVRLFDMYRGEQVPEGRRSLAFALELRAPDRTLTDEEALAVRDRIVAVLAGRAGAVLRA